MRRPAERIVLAVLVVLAAALPLRAQREVRSEQYSAVVERYSLEAG